MGKGCKSRSILERCSRTQPLMQSRKQQKPQEQQRPTRTTSPWLLAPNDTFLLHKCLEEANEKGVQGDRRFL